jgi:plastocyanin
MSFRFHHLCPSGLARASTWGVVLTLALLVAACSGQGSTASDGGAVAGAQSATVNMTDANRFEPPMLTVRKGATLVWRNTGTLAHTVTADPAKTTNPANVALPPGAQPWDSGDIRAGQSFSRKFDVPGTYRYICVPHEALGMTASLVVTE